MVRPRARGTFGWCSSRPRDGELAGNRRALTLLRRRGARGKTMFSGMDATERDALQVIDKTCSGRPRMLESEMIRIGAAGAGVQQFKECSFPRRAVTGARAKAGGESA
jgi:hypothetical protein